MIVFGACHIILDLHHLTLYAISLFTIFTQFRAFLFSLANSANMQLMDTVFIPKITPARTLVVNIGYQLFRFRLVGVLRKVVVAGLAKDEIAVCVVIGSVIAYFCTSSTEIAYVGQICRILVGERVSNRTPLLRARRHPALNAV